MIDIFLFKYQHMDNLTYALGFIVLLMLIKIFVDSDYFFLTCMTSPLDNETYCVRQRDNTEQAIQLLSKMNMKLKELVLYVKKKYPDNDAVKRLVERYNPKRVIEISPLSQHTAYSENKGEKLAFCFNKKRNIHSEMTELNTLVFVGIHELSHIASITQGHGDEFWDNFKFLLENTHQKTIAVEAKIYKPENYNKNNVDY